MKEGAKLQKQILETKLKNCYNSLESIRKKKSQLIKAEDEIRFTIEKLTKQIENFGKKKESENLQEEEIKQIPNSEDLQSYLKTLSPKQRESIPPSWLERGTSVEEIKDFIDNLVF